MASLRVALLLATTQTARAKSATLAAVASNADYVNRLYGSSNAVEGVLLYRFMVGAETTVNVVLLWVAAAGRAPAVGCRGWHVRISI